MVKTNIQTFTGEVEVLEEFYVGSNLVANDVATHVLTVNNTANDAKIKSDFFVGDGGATLQGGVFETSAGTNIFSNAGAGTANFGIAGVIPTFS